MIIDVVSLNDSLSILDIYAPYITNSVVTFENEIPTIEVFQKRIETYSAHLPWLVMKDDDEILGYAYASMYRERAAYQWVVECSVYISDSNKNKGIARKLYAALFELLKLQGIYKVYAVITIPNKESVGFHEKVGFKWFATYKNVGYKKGKWCDVGWWELTLNTPNERPPVTPLSFNQLDKDDVNAILSKHPI